MDKYQKTIREEILRLEKVASGPATFRKFLEKVEATGKLTKSVNIDEHICSFFVPVNKKTGSVFIGHHIKADSWIPPGGHINESEHPVDTVVREFFEELDYKIMKSQVKALSMTIKDISANPRNPCKVHYDFWYLVDVPKIDFKYIKKEFYDAKWMTIDEALKIMDIPLYKKIVGSIKSII